MRRFILGFVAFCGACEETPPATAPVPSASPASSDTPVVANTKPTAPDSGPSVSVIGSGAKVCGCALCDPLVSDDPCAKDDDCAPQTPCHAKSCVAKAKAQPRTPGTMCTQDLQCDSTDSNACSCVKGKCTLHAR
jgi:hypothetical protein